MSAPRQPGRTAIGPGRAPPVVVIGAGIGGLVAAVALAAQGRAVQVFEREVQPGGKLVPRHIGGQLLDGGPTVLTLRTVFDRLFALAGARLDEYLTLQPLAVLARHWWPDGSQLDLHADPAATAESIGRLAGARAAAQYLAFCARSRQVSEALTGPYLEAARPGLPALLSDGLRRGWPVWHGLWQGAPMSSLWRVLGRQFDDPRLRQLFARYATYGGSSPLAAPGTLMLIAHVEQCGVWTVAGGLYRLAEALVALAERLGVSLHCGTAVEGLAVTGGRVTGVRLADGRTVAASEVVFNGDAAALGAGLLGPEAARAVPARRVATRSLSALTWHLVQPLEGLPLVRHNVVFGADYPAEFDELFAQRRLPRDPTIYLCAQDRGDDGLAPGTAPAERLMCLVNAPASAAGEGPGAEEIASCSRTVFQRLAQLGLRLGLAACPAPTATPADWAARYPATGGALYGQATHGWRSAFNRPAARTPLPGLVLAGGSCHPGAGVPMAALSGLRAAEAVLAQPAGRTSIWPFRPVVMPGGTSTP